MTHTEKQKKETMHHKSTSLNYAQSLLYQKWSEQCKKNKDPWGFIKYDILSILAFRKFKAENINHDDY